MVALAIRRVTMCNRWTMPWTVWEQLPSGSCCAGIRIDPEIGAHLVRVVPETTYSLQGKRALLNPGSIGQPRDGDARASALLLDTEGLTATWIRVPYDIEHAQRAILDAGLPKELATRLSRGR
jgi:diadenosine tetraphosphatase ApaH/serine/threonine PP2A family protein phosphatase